MYPIIEELRELQIGIDVRINNVIKNVKCFTIMAVFDKPARAGILNIVNSTGFNSCLKCNQYGENAEGPNGN